MSGFPRTTVGGVSLSRLIAGTNWWLGFSHSTASQDRYLKEKFADHLKIADIFEVFLRAGVDTIMGPNTFPLMFDAIREAQDRTGVQAVVISTPFISANERTPAEGFDMDEVKRVLDVEAERGVAFCMPHTSTTDKMLDHCTRELRHMDQLCAAIRERGMRPGLSTHLPEAIVYADETDLDVDTYISLFNSAGFLMPLEVDWAASIIRNAHKPVMTIKPMAAGQLRPLQGLTFSWNAIRDKDMVTVGTKTPGEAEELVELSLSILEKRTAKIELQETRSKKLVKPAEEMATK